MQIAAGLFASDGCLDNLRVHFRQLKQLSGNLLAVYGSFSATCGPFSVFKYFAGTVLWQLARSFCYFASLWGQKLNLCQVELTRLTAAHHSGMSLLPTII